MLRVIETDNVRAVIDLTVGVMLMSGRLEGRKEMFYLTTHSTHFIYGYMVSAVGWKTSSVSETDI